LTAYDFAFAWRRVLAPALEAPLAPLLYDVAGAEAYHRGEMHDPDQIGIIVPDEHTFIVRLHQPTAYFLSVVATPVTAAVPRHVVTTAGESWTDAATFVGSGGFILDSHQPGKRIELVRNPHYHHPFTGNVERASICLFGTGQDDWRETARLYEADELDVITGFYPPPIGDFTRFKRRHIDDFVVTTGLAIYALAFDWQQAPFSDAIVRQAFALAIDKESFVRATRPVNALPAKGGLVPPGVPGHTRDAGLPFDPDRARQLLSKAGFPGGRGFPRVTMTWPEWPSTDQQCAWLVQQWKRFLGVSVEWRLIPNEYYASMRRNPAPISLIAWGADYLDPDNFLRVAIRQRYDSWPNERYSRLVKQARRLTSQLRRLALYQEADRIISGDAYIVPLAYEGSLLLLKPWVKHSRAGVGGPFSWKSVIVEPH
jgi:ABC-type oligopeptide transport system substrate-binding subunit